jgi:subfamily B ATP-binding cassette protein MsbA
MRLFLRLLGYVRPYWRRLLAALACMAVFALLNAVSLGMVLPFANILFERGALVETSAETGEPVVRGDAAVEPPADAEGTFGAVEGLRDELRQRVLAAFVSRSPAEALAKICLALLAVFFVKNVFGYLQTFLMVQIEQRVIRDIRNALFAKLSGLSLSFFHGRRTGQLMSRITNDVTMVRRALVATLANVFRESLLTLVFLTMAIIVSWRLALITFVVLPPIILVITRVGKRLRKRSERIQEKMADITSTLEETISGIRVVKAFGMEDYERRRFFRQTGEFFRRMIRLERLAALAGPLTEYLGVVGAVVVLWYGGRQVLIEESISPDLFLMFLAAALSTLTPLRKLSRANNELQVGLAAAGRIFSILDTPAGIKSPPGARAVESFDDRIAYEGVGFSYESGGPVLSGIDLDVAKGDIVAIVGPSGAGKSTLADLLPRFYDPTEGRITLDGRPLTELDLASLRGLMGIVTQETILFNDTVRNNIAYGLEGAPEDAIVAAARAANAHRFIESMPEGYDTEIGERGLKLSGGERQRMAIARAILKNPPILIFDEATSSLDTESERLVQEAIEHLLKGRTVLVIAHRLSTIRNADRIVVLDGGRITEAGTHQELMDLGGLYRHLYDMQFRDEPIERDAVRDDPA